MFLDMHHVGYSLSGNDICSSIMTGFSAFPYAQRHWELSIEKQEHAWKNKAISVILSIPVIGGFFGLVERIIFFVKKNFFHDPQEIKIWKPHSFNLTKTFEKMTRNLHKAIAEHAVVEQKYLTPMTSTAYPFLKQVLTQFENSKTESEPLTITPFLAEHQGARPAMEDVSFSQHTEYGTLSVILDGHGGAEVARYAIDQIRKKFFKILDHTEENVHRTFELLIDYIEKNVRKRKEWETMGTTALICFLNKKNQIYTATLGDSESNIYRIFGQELKSISLSCLRNWGCVKDAKRAARSLNDETVAATWPEEMKPKDLRFPLPDLGLNVSRAIGDEEIKRVGSEPGVTHKPKISMCTLQPGDVVILACDGLKDFVPENEIIAVLQQDPADPAAELVKYAIKKRHRHQDNISVIALKLSRNGST